jgi:hypothetical protein
VGDERSGDLELASLAARARAGRVLGFVREPELLEQRGGTSRALSAVEIRQGFEDREEVLLAGDPLEALGSCERYPMPRRA